MTMKPLSALPFALASLLARATQPAHAGRPFVTEDAGVLERGECEWESFAGRARGDGLTATQLATQVGCGIGLKSQVAASVGQAKVEGIKARSVGINGKTNLFRSADESGAFTLAWGFDSTRVLGEDVSTRFLNLVYSHRIQDKVTVHLNYLGARSSGGGSTETTRQWALAAEVPLAGDWEIGAEVFGTKSSDASIGLGARWNLSKQLSLNASLHTTTESPRVNTATVGAKLAF